MTPLELSFLIHCYVSPGRESPFLHTDPGLEALSKFSHADIITPYDGIDLWRTTEKGEAFLKMILDTPYPEQRYIDPRCGAVL